MSPCWANLAGWNSGHRRRCGCACCWLSCPRFNSKVQPEPSEISRVQSFSCIYTNACVCGAPQHSSSCTAASGRSTQRIIGYVRSLYCGDRSVYSGGCERLVLLASYLSLKTFRKIFFFLVLTRQRNAILVRKSGDNYQQCRNTENEI